MEFYDAVIPWHLLRGWRDKKKPARLQVFTSAIHTLHISLSMTVRVRQRSLQHVHSTRDAAVWTLTTLISILTQHTVTMETTRLGVSISIIGCSNLSFFKMIFVNFYFNVKAINNLSNTITKFCKTMLEIC